MQGYLAKNADSADYVSKPFREQKGIDFICKNEDFVAIDFELLISRISSRLVHFDSKKLDCVIKTSLQGILDFLHIDRAALFQEEEPGSKRFALTHANVRTGYRPEERSFFTTDSFPWMVEQLLRGREIKYSRIDDLPKEAAIDKENLREFGSRHSVLAVPLFDRDKVYGILALGAAKEMVWPEALISRLNVVAHVLSGALLHEKTVQKLHQSMQELEKLKKQLERENLYIRHEIKTSCSTEKIVYQSAAMSAALSKAERGAPTNATVLFYGETGTGKEIFASLIHKMSPRGQKTMVRVNCGAIPAALVESEMFGREKGAYTGSVSSQIGRFELANASTIFLDEITDLPMNIQVKLLRVLQEKEIERLGNPKPIHVDIRVIAATNQNIEKAVQEGRFRQDLYYRLNVFPIELPPLRQRREDIPMLVWAFVDELSNEFGKKVESIPSKCMEALLDYSWPGNVRELRNTIERAMIISDSLKLHIEVPKTTTLNGFSVGLTLKEMEIQHIRRVLENAAWKIRGKHGAADILGMKPTTLETRMAKLGIRRPGNIT